MVLTHPDIPAPGTVHCRQPEPVVSEKPTGCFGSLCSAWSRGLRRASSSLPFPHCLSVLCFPPAM
ncbi:hypothetical protein [Bacteroides stercoris]|uniref:hypothetical protein n=1 Tax=Bacteroides stercoris TaxID=46506 RepID=UPI003567FF7B